MPTIRELKPYDAQEYYSIRLSALETSPEAFSSSAKDWRQRSLQEVEHRLADKFESVDEFLLGAFEDSKLIGTMGMSRETYPRLRHKATVVGVFVETQWRGKGVSRSLLDELIERAEEAVGLEQLQLVVATTAVVAIGLYKSRGFEVFGVEKHARLVNGQFYDQLHMQHFLAER
jgi:RimJ/RimL family protein N-acetyltransferase